MRLFELFVISGWECLTRDASSYIIQEAEPVKMHSHAEHGNER